MSRNTIGHTAFVYSVKEYLLGCFACEDRARAQAIRRNTSYLGFNSWLPADKKWRNDELNKLRTQLQDLGLNEADFSSIVEKYRDEMEHE